MSRKTFSMRKLAGWGALLLLAAGVAVFWMQRGARYCRKPAAGTNLADAPPGIVRHRERGSGVSAHRNAAR